MITNILPVARPEEVPHALALLVAERGGVDEEILEQLRGWLGALRIWLQPGSAPPAPMVTVAAEGTTRLVRPLRFGGQSLGSLVVELAAEAPPVEPNVLDAIAATCAVALASRPADHGDTDRWARVRRAIDWIHQCIAERPESTRLLDILAAGGSEIVQADAAAVATVDLQSHELDLRAVVGEQCDQLATLLRSAGSRFTQPVLESMLPRAYTLEQEHGLETARGALASLGVVPLTIRQRTVGVLVVASVRTAAFTSDQLDALVRYADEGAAALENARLFEALQERVRELTALHEISRVFNLLGDLDAALETLVTRIGGLLDAERCVVLLLNEEKTELVGIKPALGLTPEQIEQLRIPVRPDSAAHRAWRTGEPYRTSDATAADSRHLAGYARSLGDRTLMIAPLQVSGRPLGVIRVSNKRNGTFTEGDARLLMVLATQAAAVIENQRLFSAVEREREMLRAVFEHSSDGIVVVDENQRVVTFNTGMERLTGYPASEMIGRQCHERYQCHSESGQVLCYTACPLTRVMGNGEQIPYLEARFSTRDGGMRDVAVSYSVVTSPTDPSKRYGISIARDISHLKEVERAKSAFISTVSHELRTPLASIQASIGVLKEHLPPDFPEPLRKLVGNVDRSSQRLKTIVSDLLDLARLQDGRIQLDLRRIDLRDPVDGAVATIRPLAEDKQQTVEVERPDHPVRATADRGRIEQITLNLLSNAVKYSPAGSTIRVRVAHNGQQAVISVTDQGPGIPIGERERIFERFYRRSDNATQRAIGSGLGLPIARALVELHQGRIWVESNPDGGSIFSFAIPTLAPSKTAS